MMFWNLVSALLFALPVISALRWHPDHVGYNLNENQTATHPRDYWGEWDNHTYQPSPQNWRFPFYMLTIDRYVDGDPTNNEANGTVFEHHWLTNQFRFGGDAKGLQDDLDYIQGIGIKVSLYSPCEWRTLTNLCRLYTLWEVHFSTGHGQEMASGHWISPSWIVITVL
jgi:hypothetical protein